jgi:hypothetical protein
VQNQINNFSFHPLRAPIMSLGARVLGLREWISS